MDRPALVVVALMVALATAGCIGGSGGAADDDTTGNDTSGNVTDDAPPTDAPPTAVEHVHDRWEDQDRKVVFDDTVTTGSTTDVGPDQTLVEAFICAFTCASAAEFSPPEGKIVPPGTDRLVVDADWPEPPADDQAPLHVDFLYQPADEASYTYHSERADPGSWEINTTVEMADGGHAEASLWKFLFFVHRHDPTDRYSMPRTATDGFSIDVTITAHRVDGELPEEPPHPDWFANGSRVIHDNSGSGTTTGAGIFFMGEGEAGEYLNGTEHGIVPPGTAELTMTINWTNEAQTADVAPVRPYVGYSREFGFGDWTRWTPETAEPGHHSYSLALEEDAHDGMYAERSRWVFQWWLAGESLDAEDPLFGTPMSQPHRFDGSWTAKITAHPEA